MFEHFAPLICERVALQSFSEDDITIEYIGWLNNPEVVKYSNQKFVSHTMESSLEYLHSFSNTGNIYLSIKNNNKLIGSITAYIQSNHATADMGLMIGDQESWGKGFGLEVWSNLMEHLFASKKIRKVTGGTLATNVGMIKIMEKSGMLLEAIRYKQEVVDGSPVDILYFSKFNDA